MVRTASTAIVRHHFNNGWANFSLASLMIGSSCGLVAFPLISYYSFLHHDFSRVMLNIALVMGIHILCGLTYSLKPCDPEEQIFIRNAEEYTIEEDEPSRTCSKLGRALINIVKTVAVSTCENLFPENVACICLCVVFSQLK